MYNIVLIINNTLLYYTLNILLRVLYEVFYHSKKNKKQKTCVYIREAGKDEDYLVNPEISKSKEYFFFCNKHGDKCIS